MASIINASATGVGGVITTADASGQLALQGNGTTVATATSTGFQVNTYSAATSLITSGTAVASTSGTSIDFTSIPSWVKRITVMVLGVSTNGGSIPQIQLGTSGGIVTSGYLGSQAYLSSGTTGQSNLTTGLSLGQNASANHIRHGIVTICNISGNTWVSSAQVGTSNVAEMGIGAASIALSGTLDRIRITTVNGTDTFDAGSINILYE